MDWNKIHDWMDRFHSDVVESKREIRGRTFCGCHFESWDRDEIYIVMETLPLGTTLKERLYSTVFDHQIYEVALPFSRFQLIVEGKDEIQDEEWEIRSETSGSRHRVSDEPDLQLYDSDN